MTIDEIGTLKPGDMVQITEPVRRHGSKTFTITLTGDPGITDLGIVYLTGTKRRADGSPDKRSKPDEVYAVNAAWVEKGER